MIEISKYSEKFSLRDLNEKQQVMLEIFNKCNKMISTHNSNRILIRDKDSESLDERVKKFNEKKKNS